MLKDLVEIKETMRNLSNNQIGNGIDFKPDLAQLEQNKDDPLNKEQENNFAKYIFNRVQVTERDFNNISNKETFSREDLNNILAMKINQLCPTADSHPEHTKKIFRNFYMCVSNFYKISLNYVKFIALFLRNYDY